MTVGKSPARASLMSASACAIIGFVRLDRLVRDDDVRHQLVKLRVMKHRPPRAFRLALARRRDLPALDLLELRRHDRRRPLEVGADRRAAGERERGEKRRRGRRPEAAARCRSPGGASTEDRSSRRLLRPAAARAMSGVREAIAKSPSRPACPAARPFPEPSFRRHSHRWRKSRRGRSRTRFGALQPPARQPERRGGSRRWRRSAQA